MFEFTKTGVLNKIDNEDYVEEEHIKFFLKQEFCYIPSKCKMVLMYNDEIHYINSNYNIEDITSQILCAGDNDDDDENDEESEDVNAYISQNPRTKALCSPDPKYCAGLTKIQGTLYIDHRKDSEHAIRSLYSQPFFRKHPPSLASYDGGYYDGDFHEFTFYWYLDKLFERNEDTASMMDKFLWKFYHMARIDSKEHGYRFEPMNPKRIGDMMVVPRCLGYFTGNDIERLPIILEENFPVILRYYIQLLLVEVDMELDDIPESFF